MILFSLFFLSESFGLWLVYNLSHALGMLLCAFWIVSDQVELDAMTIHKKFKLNSHMEVLSASFADNFFNYWVFQLYHSYLQNIG